MKQIEKTGCVLLADITGSTALYESEGNTKALQQVNLLIENLKTLVLRRNGVFVHSRGDDFLCFFESPFDALEAAKDMLWQQSGSRLSVHAGLHHGAFIQTQDDIFGDTVNVAARLCSLANSGEAAISEHLVALLPDDALSMLRLLDAIRFKGKADPIRVYILHDQDTAIHTQISFEETTPAQHLTKPSVEVTLTYGGTGYSCHHNQSLTIGRASSCDIVLPKAWVSRHHATVTVMHDKVQFIDRSSGGTYLTLGGNPEISILRETVLLMGSGSFSPARSNTRTDAEIIQFEVKNTSE